MRSSPIRLKASLLLAAPVPLLASAAAGGAVGGEPFIMTEHTMFLVIQLGLILFAAKAGNLLFSRLKLPAFGVSPRYFVFFIH